MRILFVRKGSVEEPGAAALEFMPRILADMGHEVSIIYVSGAPPKRLQSGNIRLIRVERTDGWLGALRKVARNLCPEIYHVYIHHGCGIYPFVLGLGGRRSVFVLDIRSPLLSVGISRRLRQWKNFFESLGYDAVCAHGVEAGKTVVGSLRAIHWLPPGVDLSLVPRQGTLPQGPHSPLRIVYCGTGSPKRGLPRMLEALALASKRVGLSVDLFIYNGTLEEIRSRIRKLGLADLVSVHERIPREELFAKLVNYDVGLAYVPKIPYDTAPPLKTQEYLACGLVVVATDTLGNRMFVKDGVNGVLAGEDPVSYSKGICEVTWRVVFPEARKAARDSMMAFDWKRIVAERLLPLYERLLVRVR